MCKFDARKLTHVQKWGYATTDCERSNSASVKSRVLAPAPGGTEEVAQVADTADRDHQRNAEEHDCSDPKEEEPKECAGRHGCSVWLRSLGGDVC